MSYFMTVSGIPPKNRPEAEFLPVFESQQYILDLAEQIEREDGSPLFLAYDGESSTSSGFIADAWTHFHMTGALKGCALHSIIKDCIEGSIAFRIWWASDRTDDFRRVTTCGTFNDIISTIASQIESGHDIAVRWKSETANTRSEAMR